MNYRSVKQIVNSKLFMYLSNYDVVKAYGEWRSVSMEKSGHLHVLAPLPPGKDRPVLIGEEEGCVPEPVFT
jgi:hypothetical protein